MLISYFIYSNDDFELMKTIFMNKEPGLESKFYLETNDGMIIHFHMRDFELGAAILTNIANIDHSRRMIILLTRLVNLAIQ